MSYKTQLSSIEETTILKNITESSKTYIIYNFLLEGKYNFIAYLVENNFELELAKKEIEFYSKDIEVLKFPEWDIVPYDINSPDIKVQTERIECLYKLLDFNNKKKSIILISKNAIIQKIIDKTNLKYINFYIGQKITKGALKDILENNCYENKDTATTLGDYCINNNTVDIITFNERCYRIKIIDNTIIEIRSFNPNTQITFNNYENILILPIREVIFNNDNIQNFKKNYRNLFNTSMENDNLYRAISNNILYSGCENWLPLFYSNPLISILDYIPNNSTIAYSSKIKQAIADFRKTVEKYYRLRNDEKKIDKNIYNPVEPELMYFTMDALELKLNKYTNLIFDIDNTIEDERQITLNFEQIPDLHGNENETFKNLKKYLENQSI